MDSLAIIFVLSLTVFTVSTAKVGPETKSFIATLLKQYLREVNSGEVFEPRLVYPAVRNSNSVKRPTLPVLLWDPLVQFPDIFNGFMCPYCTLENNHGFLRTSTIWNDGTSKKRSPRTIFDITHPVLLVPRRYRCSIYSDHCFVATHVSIMEHLEKHKSIAFKLTVKSGYFHTLSEAVCAMIDRGMSFTRIENIIKSIYQETGIIAAYQKDKDYGYPSAKFLESIFLSEFDLRENEYITSMKKTTADWLSADHTFKSVMNIGYPRKVDGKWVKVFNALFCVLNEYGQIIKWRFTRSTESDETKALFQELSCRLKAQNKRIAAMYVDNCCQIRKKMRTFFGDNKLQVKLDLFHAIHRFLATVPKRLHARKMIAREYRNVFRAIGDYGKSRKRDTPSPDVMMRNLERFERKWKGFRCNKQLVLKKKSKRALQNIKIHIQKGCLSHIPPGCGTNRNERLHRKLRKIAGRNKLGVRLAFALFTRAFHLINQEIKRKTLEVKEMEANIEENFGLFKKSLELDLQAKPRQEYKNNSSFCEKITTRAEIAHAIFNQALGNGLGELESQVSHQFLLHFKPRNSYDYHTISSTDLLDQRLKNMGLQRCPTAKDGDCFFTSLAIQIISLMRTCGYEIIDHFCKKGITPNQSVIEIVRQLRKLVVQEWLSNESNYHHLVDATLNYTVEATQFLTPGYFAASIGDAMPLASANALQFPIALVTSVENMPFTIVTPEVECITDVPLILAFTQEDGGHYDSVIQEPSSGLQNRLQTEQTNCRCGVNSKDPSKMNCCVVPTINLGKKRKYSSRCKCLKASIACGKRCRCKNCGNGKIALRTSSQKSRNSHKRKFTKSSFSQHTSPEAFVLDREGDCKIPHNFSVLEMIMLQFCIFSIGVKCRSKSAEQVTDLFNRCIDFNNHRTKNRKLPNRSVNEIKEQMKKLNVG